MLTVTDAEATPRCVSSLGAGLVVGDCGAAPLAALRALASEPECAELREAVGLGAQSRVVLVASEGSDRSGGLRARDQPGVTTPRAAQPTSAA